MEDLKVDSVYPGFDQSELLALARLDLDKGNIESALSKVKKALSMEENNPDALSMIGKIYAQIGLYEKSKVYLKKYLKLQPESVTENFQYGMVHFDSGDRDTALSVWNELLESNPTHPPSLFYKGLVLAQKDDIADARKALGILLQSAPADNLYFGKAKELLQSLESRNAKLNKYANSKEESEVTKSLPENAYKVIN